MSRWEIIVPFDPHRTSLNQRLHWRERCRRNQAAAEAAHYGWAKAGRPYTERRVRVSVLVRRGRVLDRDNVIAGLKPVADLLFSRRHGIAMTPDDGPQWVEWGSVEFETGKRWRDRPEVVLVVEEVE